VKDSAWCDRLPGLENINVAKDNSDWENVCIAANSAEN